MPIEVNLVKSNELPDQHMARGIRPIEDVRVSKVLYVSKDEPRLPVATLANTIEKTYRELKHDQLILEDPKRYVGSTETLVSVLPGNACRWRQVGYC